MKKILNNRPLLMLVVTIITLIPAYFLFFDDIKDKLDSRKIYYMYGTDFSDEELKSKIKSISDRNINVHDRFGLPLQAICNDNTEILKLILNKGGEFRLLHLSVAYGCRANNSIIFLENQDLSVFDNDLSFPINFIKTAISKGNVDKEDIKFILEKNPKLTTNKKLIQLLKSDVLSELPSHIDRKKELLLLFSVESTEDETNKP